MERIFAAAVAIVLLSGCATGLSQDVRARLDQIGATATPPASPRGGFAVTDQRDPDARRVHLIGGGIAGGFSCNIGLEQLGDDDYAADRIVRLENALAAAFPDRAANASLIVRRYDIYLNHSAENNSRNMAAAFGGGLIAAAIAPNPDSEAPVVTRRPRCARDRMKGGWFDPSDLTNNNPPITVEIEVTVFGREHAITAALSPEISFFELNLGFPLRRDPSAQRAEAVLQAAMAKANARMVEAIANDAP